VLRFPGAERSNIDVYTAVTSAASEEGRRTRAERPASWAHPAQWQAMRQHPCSSGARAKLPKPTGSHRVTVLFAIYARSMIDRSYGKVPTESRKSSPS
jgi:hypothetical protein